MNKLRAAIEAFPGKQAGVAAALGKTQGAVSHWVTGRHKPEPRDVPRIAHLLGISCHDIHEDVFGPAPEAQGQGEAA